MLLYSFFYLLIHIYSHFHHTHIPLVSGCLVSLLLLVLFHYIQIHSFPRFLLLFFLTLTLFYNHLLNYHIGIVLNVYYHFLLLLLYQRYRMPCYIYHRYLLAGWLYIRLGYMQACCCFLHCLWWLLL